MEDHTRSVADHYHADDIAETILGALEDAGRPRTAITIDDLAPADEVHTRGREATVELAGLTSFSSDLRVVDVGCGVGGPARYLASTFGCHVTGIDLTPGFVDAAARLTHAVGLSDKVSFHCGSALQMPFEDAAFDLAWTVQMQMNIADKPRLYAEIARVLEPGGRFVFQDIVSGDGGDLLLPVPWASDASHSHLAAPQTLRQTILDAGFTEILWRDVSEPHREWTRAQAARPAATTSPPVAIHMVLGPGATEKRRNSSRCLMQHRIGFVQGVFEKR